MEIDNAGGYFYLFLLGANSLCCCEYIDKHGQRNHILACCCNCVELDETVDRVCCCRTEGKTSCIQVLSTLSDRMRVPWVGGAKQISWEVVVPVILVPSLVAFGSLGSPCTAVAFASMPLLILHLHKAYFRNIPNSKFYCAWTYTSLTLIFLIYELLVCPLLEISVEENCVFIAISVVSVISLYKVKTLKGCHNPLDIESARSNLSGSNENSLCSFCGTVMMPRMAHCNTCQMCIPKRELHCLWFGCCVGSHNLLWFVTCLLSLSIGLLYSSNLILTTVCRPYRVWGSLLLPEDCSEVYYEFRFAICYVSGLYSLIMAVLPIFALLRQFWLVSLGITGNEWRTMPLSHLLRLGFTAHRPYNQGLLMNWYHTFTTQNVNK